MVVKSYTISTAFTNGAVNTNALQLEISESATVTGFSGLTIEGDNLNVLGTSLPNAEALDAIITAHNAASAGAKDYVKGRILSAMSFGQNLMAEYGAENVLAGKTTAQVQSIMEQTGKIQTAFLSGSLYVALNEIESVVPDGTLITQATLDNFRHKIQDYLGIPRT